MRGRQRSGAEPRRPLSRDRVVDEAVAVADDDGIEAVTMRGIATRLGVEAMSLYHHVANKDDLLDGMVDRVMAEVELPRDGDDWWTGMRRRAASARAVLRRHPWAIALMDSRSSPGPATLRHHEAVLACLRGDGFSIDLAARAFAVLDSFVFGFALQEKNLPFEGRDELPELVDSLLAGLPPEEFPHLREIAVHHVLQEGYEFGDQFDAGLDLILDGLENARAAAP